MRFPVGMIISDAQGKRWIYYGFRITSAGAECHHFVEVFEGVPRPPRTPWTWNGVNLNTIRKKFPYINYK